MAVAVQLEWWKVQGFGSRESRSRTLALTLAASVTWGTSLWFHCILCLHLLFSKDHSIMKRLVCIAHLQYSEILEEEECVLMVFIFQICLFDE